MLKYTSCAWNSTRANTTQLFSKLSFPIRCRPTIFGASLSPFHWVRAKRCARDYAGLLDLRRLAECDLASMKVESHLRGLVPGWNSAARVRDAKPLKLFVSSVDFIDAGSCPTRMRKGSFLGLRNQ